MIPVLGGRQADAEPRGGSPAPMSTHRILIVDEAHPVRRSLRDILHKLGVQDDDINEATEPDEALSSFQLLTPHVVFAEFIGVHTEEGLEIIHEFLDRGLQTKVVLVTAESRDSPEVRAAVRAGVFAVVEKPIRFEKIRQVLQDVQSEEGGVERMR